MSAASRRGSETKDRIIDAAIETVRDEGFADTTAREIARRGGFNQALIFYHFGSVDELLMEAFGRVSSQQVAAYREAVSRVSSLSDLVDVARRLHHEDLASGSVTAVTQLMAAATDPEQGGVLLDRFDEWIVLVEEALSRAAGNYPIASAVPPRQAAYAIAAMFLGIELMSRLDPERSEADAVFDVMETMARLIEQLAPTLPNPSPG
ncbi:MAG: TetR/AcrR family transcriptional regulator [Actinomycetota bacterium]